MTKASPRLDYDAYLYDLYPTKHILAPDHTQLTIEVIDGATVQYKFVSKFGGGSYGEVFKYERVDPTSVFPEALALKFFHPPLEVDDVVDDIEESYIEEAVVFVLIQLRDVYQLRDRVVYI